MKPASSDHGARTGLEESDEIAAGFVERFAAAWADPNPERLNDLVHADVEFIQPLEAPIHGRDAAAEFWHRFFTVIPDARGEVLTWAHRDDQVFIELRIRGTIGRHPIEWDAVDRITLDESGLVRQRVAYLNPLAIAPTILRHPCAIAAWARGSRKRLLLW